MEPQQPMRICENCNARGLSDVDPHCVDCIENGIDYFWCGQKCVYDDDGIDSADEGGNLIYYCQDCGSERQRSDGSDNEGNTN